MRKQKEAKTFRFLWNYRWIVNHSNQIYDLHLYTTQYTYGLQNTNFDLFRYHHVVITFQDVLFYSKADTRNK